MSERDVLVESSTGYSQIIDMGKVVVKIKLTNLFDLALYNRRMSKRKPRGVEVESLVDTKRRRLIPNPAHGGEQMTEEY